MKKLIAFLILCVSLAVSCNDDLLERVEALEKATSVSLKSSISTLESQFLNLKIQIAALNLKDNTGQIAALELSLSQIEAELEELRAMMDSLLEEISADNNDTGKEDTPDDTAGGDVEGDAP